MPDTDTAVAIAEFRKEIGSLKHRMDGVERIVDAVHSLAIEMAKQTEEIRHMSGTVEQLNQDVAELKEIRHMSGSVEQLNQDVAELKEKPADRWDNLIDTLIGAIAGAAAALIFK